MKLHTLRILPALLGLGLAITPYITQAQISMGTVDLLAGTPTDTTYDGVQVFDNGVYNSGSNPTGTNTPVGYGDPSPVTFSNQNASVTLPTSLILFCSELGQDTSQNNNQTYQILDSGSLQYADATNLPVTGSDPTGSPNPMGSVAQFETNGNITATGGIGPSKATELSELYGYAFGATGALSSGYNLTSVSTANQVAFQVAVWKLVYDGSGYIPAGSGVGSLNTTAVNTITTTGLSITGIDAGVANEANLLLQAVYTNNNGNGITAMGLNELNNGTYQDFLIPTTDLVPIPEPSTYAAILSAAALGFAMICGRRRVA